MPPKNTQGHQSSFFFHCLLTETQSHQNQRKEGRCCTKVKTSIKVGGIKRLRHRTGSVRRHVCRLSDVTVASSVTSRSSLGGCRTYCLQRWHFPGAGTSPYVSVSKQDVNHCTHKRHLHLATSAKRDGGDRKAYSVATGKVVDREEGPAAGLGTRGGATAFRQWGQYFLFISLTACFPNFSGGNNIVLPPQPQLSGGKLPPLPYGGAAHDRHWTERQTIGEICGHGEGLFNRSFPPVVLPQSGGGRSRRGRHLPCSVESRQVL